MSVPAPSSPRPKDMTEAELEALPVGPDVIHERPITREDWEKGRRGRTVVTVEYRRVRCTAWTTDDILAWRDQEGRVWDFGQWADGTWFKQPSILG